jgi:hypothetical protein
MNNYAFVVLNALLVMLLLPLWLLLFIQSGVMCQLPRCLSHTAKHVRQYNALIQDTSRHTVALHSCH